MIATGKETRNVIPRKFLQKMSFDLSIICFFLIIIEFLTGHHTFLLRRFDTIEFRCVKTAPEVSFYFVTDLPMQQARNKVGRIFIPYCTFPLHPVQIKKPFESQLAIFIIRSSLMMYGAIALSCIYIFKSQKGRFIRVHTSNYKFSTCIIRCSTGREG